MDKRRQFRGRYDNKNEKINRLIQKIKTELVDSIVPVSLTRLNPLERKRIHRFFDHDPNVATKTYKISDNEFELRVYPVGNLRRYAEKMAEEVLQTGEKKVLSPMSSYERFVVHEALKNIKAVKSISYGEAEDRHVEIEPEIFGRGLKKIIKKIRLF